MKIAIGSAFRNSEHYIGSYIKRVLALRETLKANGHSLYQIAVWGDSTDQTAHALWSYAQRFEIPLRLVERSHGGPVFGSTETPERMKALSGVGNGILESVTEDTDVLVYVESDLIWQAEVMWHLIGLVGKPAGPQAGAGPQDWPVDCVSPLVFAGMAFYDIFAFRGYSDGERFSPIAPYHQDFVATGAALVPVKSAGSCLVMRGDMARKCRIGITEGLVSFCADARSYGYHLWADSRARIEHPR